MDSLEFVAEKLPDIYFDWYARLLPGGAAVLFVLMSATADEQGRALEHPFVLLAASYLLGHFIQPASAFFVKKLERDKKREDAYAEYKRRDKKERSLIRKVSKAHAEAVSMMSAALLVMGALLYHGFVECRWNIPSAIVAILLMVFSSERVEARNRKIDDLNPKTA